jgi:hypothetical protein
MTEIARVRSLFTIEQEYLHIMDVIESMEGEVTPEIAAMLEINREDLERKMKAYHHVMVMNQSDIVACNNEIERLQGLVERKNKITETLKKAMLTATLLYGETGKTGNKKLKFDTLQMWTKKSESVSVNEDTFDDADYTKYTTTYKFTKKQIEDILEKANVNVKEDTIHKVISKTDIKDAIEKGVIVKDAIIVKKDSLTIK